MKNSLNFQKESPQDLETLLPKIDLPSIYIMIMKILITRGNPTLMPKGATDEKLNDLLPLVLKTCNTLLHVTFLLG